MKIEVQVKGLSVLIDRWDAACEREDAPEAERIWNEIESLKASHPREYERYQVSLMSEPVRRFEPHNPNPVRLAPSENPPIGRTWQPKNRRAWDLLN